MRKIYESNGIVDIYIDLEETSYHDPKTISWLWDTARVVFSGHSTTPIRYDGKNVILGWEDDGHICFDQDSLVTNSVYFQTILRDGDMLLRNLEKEEKAKTKKKKEGGFND